MVVSVTLSPGGGTVYDRVLGLHGRVRGGSIHVGVAPLNEQTWYYGLELLPEVLVHPGVQKGIINGRAHCYHVCNKEEQYIVIPVLDATVVFRNDVHSVKWQPAADKDAHHCDQHLVCSALAPNFHFIPVPVCTSASNSHAAASLQHQRHLSVTENDDATRHNVL
eukprot:GHVT01045667.1.p2 GENE.GHVT01045667.1~~GHVT01045667.1.p2  ORF type:complete len:165 (+),score=5.00 GHVT01045667.1:482-976(+)